MVYNRFFDPEIYELVNEQNKIILDDFLMELNQSQKSENTIYQYKRDLKGFFCYIYENLNNEFILNLTKRDFRRYSIYIQSLVSNARHNRLLSSIRSLLNFAENEEEDFYSSYDRNIAEKVKSLPKDRVRDIVFLTDKQVLKLVDKLTELKEFQKATLVSLAYDSCARKNELSQVTKISFMNSELNNTNIVRGKGGKEFPLLYFNLTKRSAKLWLEKRGEDNIDSLWIVGSGDNVHSATNKNLYDWIIFCREILEDLEDDEIPFNLHSFRHSGLENYSRGDHYICREKNDGQGFSLEKLKLLANHESISTTQSYLKDNSIQELEELFDIKIDE